MHESLTPRNLPLRPFAKQIQQMILPVIPREPRLATDIGLSTGALLGSI
jgi:hypothetical protein